ncbi:dicarboxylate/amino acid:cation symporter [Alkalihalobacillus sp. LMS6]|uniref:dicarboxylate/amino acid:cation symporter n=1 Tax=Alkalihalobacillus sp. LMS6 TaxID=2924034 RepID=UPI0020D020E1|nr:dicarboxylate/amino acid:cation symporter [Alkalihalobacillus sp. LMS6]UTR07017.1 dicarboxylate/amino acid:cation symporter [Alkalihalobacillus sp. LMS6]
MKWWFNRPLYTQIAIGAVLGITVGLILGEQASLIAFVGEIFLSLLKMLVVPLVVTSLLSGITKMKDARSLGQIGARFMGYLVLTSILATSVGIIVALLMKPGSESVGMFSNGEEIEPTTFQLTEQFLSWIPSNVFASLSEMNLLQIIVFTLFIGIVLITLGESKVPTIYSFINESADVMLKLTEFVIKFAPYGIFALLANLIGTFGNDLIGTVTTFILSVYIGLLIVLLVVYPLIIRLIGKQSPIQFYKNVSPTMLFAFTTSTSSATIPVSLQVSKTRLGIPEKIYSFTVPFGATVNMDGFSVAIGVISVFAAYVYDIPITFTLILQFVLMGILLSIGAAGVRGAGIVMTTVLFETLGMPLYLIPVLAAVWPIIDAGLTTTNMTSDLVGSTAMAKMDHTLDEQQFQQANESFRKEA